MWLAKGQFLNHGCSWANLRTTLPGHLERQSQLSIMDFMIAPDMVQEGHDPQEILRLLADSPRIAKRKVGHLQDYLERTVISVFGALTPFSRPLT